MAANQATVAREFHVESYATTGASGGDDRHLRVVEAAQDLHLLVGKK